jgi:hypothetical protein
MIDDEDPPSPEELAAAEALRRALEGDLTRDDTDARTARMIAAAAGRAPRLGDLAARAIVLRAFAEVGREQRPAAGPARARRRWRISGLLGAATAALVLVTLATPRVPRRWQSRPGGLLVPGPFPPQQTAAQRLDLVTTDRMMALREARLYGARR